MKRNIDFKIVIIIILLIIFCILAYLYFKPEETFVEDNDSTTTSSSTTTISEAPVEIKTILNTISSSRRNCYKCRRKYRIACNLLFRRNLF